MFEHLVVPVDLSDASFEAIPIAARMAEGVGGRLDVVTVVEHLGDVSLARDELARAIEVLGPLPVTVDQIVHSSESVIGALSRHLDRNPGAMIAMSSHGHGRSAAVLGSTADDLLRATFGPLIMIGPRARAASGTLGGRYVVPLDGSARADNVLPIAGAWAIEFGATPWLVEVLDPDVEIPAGSEFVESTFVNRRASELAARIHRPVEFEVLHGRHTGRAIVDYAETINASLIFMATHGRTGLDRLAAGSVASDVVRHAPMPVVLFRPPTLTNDMATGGRKVASAST